MSKLKLPYMPVMVESLLSDEDCTLMSSSQFGSYMRLLFLQWLEASIPSDPGRLAHYLREPADHFAKAIWPAISTKFSDAPRLRNRLCNLKLAELRKTVMDKVEARRRNGRKGGRPKAKAPPPGDNRMVSVSLTEPEPIISNSSSNSVIPPLGGRKKSRKAKPTETIAEKIYQAYPRRIGKAKALPAIEKAIELIAERDDLMSRAAADWLLGRVQAFAASPLGQPDTKPDTPYPATWFSGKHGGRYDDEDAEWLKTWDGPTRPAGVAAPAGKYDGL